MDINCKWVEANKIQPGELFMDALQVAMIEAISIKSIGRRPVCDLTVDEVNHYITDHGLVSHNTGSYYSSDQIFIIGRQQEKDADGVTGYNFVVNVEKSRSVREKKKFSINVLYDKGINKWSGLLDLAMEAKFVVKPKNGWYAKCDPDTGEVDPKNLREAQTHTKEFWEPILKDPKFNEWIVENYQISASDMLISDIDDVISSVDDLDIGEDDE